MAIQVTHILANSSQICSSSCIFKCLRAELFFQILIVVLTPISRSCWTLTDVCEKSVFGLQLHIYKVNIRDCNTGHYSNVCSCKCILAFGSDMSLRPTYRSLYNSIEGMLAWTRLKTSAVYSWSVTVTPDILETISLAEAFSLLLTVHYPVSKPMQIKGEKDKSLIILNDRQMKLP